MVSIFLLVLLMLNTQLHLARQYLHLGTGVKTKKHPRRSSFYVHSNFQEIHEQMQRKFVTLLLIISWNNERHTGNGRNVEDFRDYNVM